MKWYQKKWFTWLLLLVFFPAGLFVLWKYSTHGMKAKLAITGFFALIVLSAAFADPDKRNQNATHNQAVTQNQSVAATENTVPATDVVQKTNIVAENVQKPVVDEKVAVQRFSSEIRRGLDAVDNDWENLWSRTVTDLSNGLIDEKTAFADLKQLENNLIEDEMIIYDAPIDTNISQETQNEMLQIISGYQQWVQQRRKSSENFRRALGMRQVNEAKAQETIQMIQQSNEILFSATAKLVALETKFE